MCCPTTVELISVTGAGSAVQAVAPDTPMKTVMYIGKYTGSAARTVRGARYLFGGEMNVRVNTMPDVHAEELIANSPLEFMEIPTELGHNSVSLQRLLEPVSTCAELMFDVAQKAALIEAGVKNAAQFLVCGYGVLCVACSVEEKAIDHNKERVRKHIGLPAQNEARAKAKEAPEQPEKESPVEQIPNESTVSTVA